MTRPSFRRAVFGRMVGQLDNPITANVLAWKYFFPKNYSEKVRMKIEDDMKYLPWEMIYEARAHKKAAEWQERRNNGEPLIDLLIEIDEYIKKNSTMPFTPIDCSVLIEKKKP